MPNSEPQAGASSQISLEKAGEIIAVLTVSEGSIKIGLSVRTRSDKCLLWNNTSAPVVAYRMERGGRALRRGAIAPPRWYWATAAIELLLHESCVVRCAENVRWIVELVAMCLIFNSGAAVRNRATLHGDPFTRSVRCRENGVLMQGEV